MPPEPFIFKNNDFQRFKPAPNCQKSGGFIYLKFDQYVS
jgi:hypothetical protein